jgi:hypothetical protein
LHRSVPRDSLSLVQFLQEDVQMKKFALVLVSLLFLSFAALAADIEMKPVESSFLSKLGYDPEAKVLAIQMQNSSDTYLYQNVPASIYADFLAADSKGAFYVEKIKGQFESTRK